MAELAREYFTITELQKAIEKARDWLLNQQKPDGHWCGELEGDTILESEYMLLLYFMEHAPRVYSPTPERVPQGSPSRNLDRASSLLASGGGATPLSSPRGREKFQKMANYILSKQRPEGDWAIYPGGPGEVSASVKAYFALKLAGHPPNAPYMQKARDAILKLGGVTACNSFTKIYLALFGQYDWDAVPAVPPEIILFPLWFYFNIYAISSWSRTILVPLSIVWAYRPQISLPPHLGIEELFIGGPKGPHLYLKPSPQPFTWRNFFLGVDRFFKWIERGPKPLRQKALKKAEQWMIDHFRKSDGLGAIFPPIINSILALYCLGYPKDHPLIRQQWRELEKLEIEEGDTLRVQPCFSPVWDTAIAIIALSEAGLPPDHPALVQAGEWLLSKEVTELGDWAVYLKGVEPGGWYFEYQNEFYPDIDDTAMVIMALDRVRLPEERLKQEAQERALRWLLAMQSSDGGWASFDKNNNRMIFTQMPFADHNAMLDPSTPDITARVLEMLGRRGWSRNHPQVKKALRFLYKEQEMDGSWYGRWGVNYIYGTWQALRGLESIGEDMMQEACQRAAVWLRSNQNPDGGWGETCGSYDDPKLKAVGPSTSSQTAWALIGLFSAGDLDSLTVKQGLHYLLSQQNSEGTWEEEWFTGTGFPRVFYLRYHLYRHYFPLMALGEYICRRSGNSPLETN